MQCSDHEDASFNDLARVSFIKLLDVSRVYFDQTNIVLVQLEKNSI